MRPSIFLLKKLHPLAWLNLQWISDAAPVAVYTFPFPFVETAAEWETQLRIGRNVCFWKDWLINCFFFICELSKQGGGHRKQKFKYYKSTIKINLLLDQLNNTLDDDG